MVKLSRQPNFRIKVVSNRRFKILRLLIIVLVLGLGFFIIKSQFAIKKVDVVVTALSCASSADIARAAILQRHSLIFLNTGQIQKKIIAKYSCIQQVEVKKVWPNKVSIKVSGRLPVALGVSDASVSKLSLKQIESTASSQAALLDFSQALDSNLEQVLIDQSGYVFSKAGDGTGLPLIRFEDQPVNVGSTVPRNLLDGVLTITHELEKMNYHQTLLRVNRVNDLIVTTSEGLKLVFSLNKDLNIQLASLQLILQKAKIESRAIDSVDLRFNKPVVVYQK